MHSYKYPPHGSTAQKKDAGLQPRSLRTELHRENRRFKMLCSRCVLPLLGLYLLMEEISAAVLPNRFRNKRESDWLDQELFSRLPDQPDLSVGDDAGDMSRDVDGRPAHSETPFASTEHLSLQRQHQNQFQHQRKANEKKRKVTPVDSIGSFQMSSFRNQRDDPDVYWQDYRN